MLLFNSPATTADTFVENDDAMDCRLPGPHQRLAGMISAG